MPQFQARKSTSLLSMQKMYSKHGPPLSLDKQLCRILQQKVFYSIPILPGRKHSIRSATTNISNRSLAYSNFQSSINHNNPHMH